MASMSYCRWHNLVHELRACKDVLETKLSTAGGEWDCEARKREDALALMADMLETWGCEIKPNGRLVVAEHDNEDFPDEDDC